MTGVERKTSLASVRAGLAFCALMAHSMRASLLAWGRRRCCRCCRRRCAAVNDSAENVEGANGETDHSRHEEDHLPQFHFYRPSMHGDVPRSWEVVCYTIHASARNQTVNARQGRGCNLKPADLVLQLELCACHCFLWNYYLGSESYCSSVVYLGAPV
jgi:hypothetical protein